MGRRRQRRAGGPSRPAPGDADLITLIDVSKRPFRAVQHLTVPATPEAVALSPDGNWIVAQTLNGSNLTPNDPGPGRQKLGRIVLFAIRTALRPGSTIYRAERQAGQGAVFAKDNKTILVQFNVEKALGVYQIRDDRLVDSGRAPQARRRPGLDPRHAPTGGSRAAPANSCRSQERCHDHIGAVDSVVPRRG